MRGRAGSPPAAERRRPAVARLLIFAALALAARGAAGQAGGSDPQPGQRPPSFVFDAGAPADLAAVLEPLRKDHGLPALAAAVVRGPRLVGSGAVGVRRVGDDTPVQRTDPFHIGSCTKAMTSTLLALLVEQGRLAWDTTVRDAFPDLLRDIRPEYHEVTLAQLLTHRSGLPEDRTPGPLFLRMLLLTGPPREQRLATVKLYLGSEPAGPPGGQMRYSNAGYAIAAAMAEERLGRPWEELMRDLLFAPLGIRTAGYGAPGTPGHVDAPWGHRVLGDRVTPVAPGPRGDNPVPIGPAGRIHLAVDDWARFASLHLMALRGQPQLLSAATFRTLHTPPDSGRYAYGWAVGERDWTAGRALGHNGSNTMWFATIWIAPARDLAVVVATNIGRAEAAQALDAVAAELARRYAAPATRPTTQPAAGKR